MAAARRLGFQTPPLICYAPSLAFELLHGKINVIALMGLGFQTPPP